MATKKRAKRRSQRQQRRPRNLARRSPGRSGPSARPSGLIRHSEPNAPESAAPRGQAPQEPVETIVDINRSICEDLTEGHPAALLLAASIVHLIGGGPTNEQSGGRGVSLLLGSLAESEFAGLRAVSYALSRMIGAEHTRQVVDRGLGSRADELPSWLRRLDETKITGCWRGYDVHHLFDIVGVGFRLPGGDEATLVVITSQRPGRILSAYVSSLGHADSGLTWARMDPSAEGMSWTRQEVAHVILECALATSDPSTTDGNQHQAEWIYYRALIIWLISLLDGEWILSPPK